MFSANPSGEVEQEHCHLPNSHEILAPTFNNSAGQGRRRSRPVRVALLYFASKAEGSEIDTLLEERFAILGIDAIAIHPGVRDFDFGFGQKGNYDVVGITGSPSLPDLASAISSFESESEPERCTTLTFLPESTSAKIAESFLRYVDSVVLCETAAGAASDCSPDLATLRVLDVVYRFFESLIVPSLLNIDISDVRNISKGIGFSFYLALDDPNAMISKLPPSCAFAKSALLHFSCKEDVTLSEVYRVSRAIASRPSMNAERTDETQLSHSNAKKFFRKMNVKLGLRIEGGEDAEEEQSIRAESDRRMNLTAILFGI
ncbi:MAG TPA: hypothetical protein VFF30_02915 [Nitrososphaerales archaeon]|nr:hypothetical protein [Nitrososphaerales archaeon]